METFYRWRVQEKDKRGRTRWRIVKSPMTESAARLWATNNHKIIERIDTPAESRNSSRPAAAGTAGRPGRSQ